MTDWRGIPEDYRNQIVTGDARILSERIPNESIDIVFTSPPYNAGLNYETVSDNLPEDEFWKLQADWITDAYRITADSARMYVVVSEEMIWHIKEIAETSGWLYHQMLVWCKPNIVNHKRISKDWNCFVEWCLLFRKGKRTPMLSEVYGINTHNWIVATSPQSNFNGNDKKVHPAQMALKVAYAWLARTPGEIVYEPFAGSGTTCKATKMLGKKFVAFEKDPGTAMLANEQVASAQLPLLIVKPEQLELDLIK